MLFASLTLEQGIKITESETGSKNHRKRGIFYFSFDYGTGDYLRSSLAAKLRSPHLFITEPATDEPSCTCILLTHAISVPNGVPSCTVSKAQRYNSVENLREYQARSQDFSRATHNFSNPPTRPPPPPSPLPGFLSSPR